MNKTELKELVRQLVREQLENSHEEELAKAAEEAGKEAEKLNVYYAYVPANLRKGSTYDYGARRVTVVAESEEEVSDIVNKSKKSILDRFDKARIPSGSKSRRLVPKPVEDNVFFKSKYRVANATPPPGKLTALMPGGAWGRFEVDENGAPHLIGS